MEALKPVSKEDRTEVKTPQFVTQRTETDRLSSRLDLAQQIRFHMRTGGGRMSLLLPSINSDFDSDDDQSAKESSFNDSASD